MSLLGGGGDGGDTVKEICLAKANLEATDKNNDSKIRDIATRVNQF